ncbi:uncharacterized protein LOC117807623 isoform X2 [Xyrichtys novacula]|uniref:Uncharacterized protein LOC117807623 isoform X2 n=1 Tax=Xyrichtys novacula TaxID=13765 RepID=A0AAV1HKN4_XYRNO|nr:uncharacterized protein LOC117807623 isoform X2 [Xyrichtys novacula]
MVSRFLLLMALSVCVSGTLVVNVANGSYEAEVGQNLTLEWTFTPKPDSSLKDFQIFCSMFTVHKELFLFKLREGVVFLQSQAEEFVGRVQCDQEVLKEGRIRLNVSSLRIEDSGQYRCVVWKNHGYNFNTCELSVTNRTVSETEPERPASASRGRIGLYSGLTAAASVVMLFIFYCLIIRLRNKCDKQTTETDSTRSFSLGDKEPLSQGNCLQEDKSTIISVRTTESEKSSSFLMQ